jgi:Family of unknown function (DUF5701)
MPGKETETELRREFDRQFENIVQKGYPEAAGLKAEELRKYIQPLKERLGELAALENEAGERRIPFVIVVKNDLVPVDVAIPLTELRDKKGFTSMSAEDLKGFKPIEGVEIPGGMAYLLVDIDTGKETLNITPDEAIGVIKNENRSPLTLDEGIALITHHPEVLKDRNCFSMLGSRCGDRRVTALWISGGKPRLGWCWAGNPHTWLGSASCGRRVGP